MSIGRIVYNKPANFLNLETIKYPFIINIACHFPATQ